MQVKLFVPPTTRLNLRCRPAGCVEKHGSQTCERRIRGPPRLGGNGQPACKVAAGPLARMPCPLSWPCSAPACPPPAPPPPHLSALASFPTPASFARRRPSPRSLLSPPWPASNVRTISRVVCAHSAAQTGSRSNDPRLLRSGLQAATNGGWPHRPLGQDQPSVQTVRRPAFPSARGFQTNAGIRVAPANVRPAGVRAAPRVRNINIIWALARIDGAVHVAQPSGGCA